MVDVAFRKRLAGLVFMTERTKFVISFAKVSLSLSTFSLFVIVSLSLTSLSLLGLSRDTNVQLRDTHTITVVRSVQAALRV